MDVNNIDDTVNTCTCTDVFTVSTINQVGYMLVMAGYALGLDLFTPIIPGIVPCTTISFTCATPSQMLQFYDGMQDDMGSD